MIIAAVVGWFACMFLWRRGDGQHGLCGGEGVVNLSKLQRTELRAMFDGHCAYCGCALLDKWHADHIEPVYREWWKRHLPEHRHDFVDGRVVKVKQDRTVRMMRPENDVITNFFPACVPCNIDKSVLSIESWRQSLERKPEVMRRNYSAWRHAERFGIVAVVQPKVVFYFEMDSTRGGGN